MTAHWLRNRVCRSISVGLCVCACVYMPWSLARGQDPQKDRDTEILFVTPGELDFIEEHWKEIWPSAGQLRKGENAWPHNALFSQIQAVGKWAIDRASPSMSDIQWRIVMVDILSASTSEAVKSASLENIEIVRSGDNEARACFSWMRVKGTVDSIHVRAIATRAPANGTELGQTVVVNVSLTRDDSGWEIRRTSCEAI